MPDRSEQIDFYGRPILLRTNSAVRAETRAKAEKMLAEEFSLLCAKIDSSRFQYLEMCQHGGLSNFAVALLRSGCTGTPVYKQIISLGVSESTLRKDVRKSYKSLISWGEKNLSITVYDHKNASPEIIDEFRRLHIAVSAKETRPSESWRVQYRQIMENQAFLITARLEGKLVSAALFLHSPLYCYYGVSASIREMFDKPLSHAILWRSLLEAKQRGCHLFEMGDLVDLHPVGYSEKERNIALFKRGFGGQTFMQLSIGKDRKGS